MKKQFFNTKPNKEQAVLIAVITEQQNELQVKEYLDELAFLTETAGAKTIARFTQRLEHPDPRTFIGKGKIEEVKIFIENNNIDLVIFDDELTASQLRNIEKYLTCKIIDRSNLILDIFAKRARTSQSKTQVELAQYQYLLPRLTRMWTHLEKQKGGIGLKGPGETEIETDRRRIRTIISTLKTKLKEIETQNTTQRKNRSQFIRVALVGYTNTGKSTIMNLLSKSNVLAENKLFATLDTTVRKVVIEDIPFLLSDTVGFIRKLPHDLVESFKSTLDEVREADMLLHVIDISHPKHEEQVKVVVETLHEIGAGEKPKLNIFNKTDLFHLPENISGSDSPQIDDLSKALYNLKQSWMNKVNVPCYFISALKKQNISELKLALSQIVRNLHYKRYPNTEMLQ